MTDNIESIVLEARDTFDLSNALSGRPMRKPRTVTVFTDEATGEDLGWTADKLNEYGAVIGRERVGVIGQIEEAHAGETIDNELVLRLEAEATALLEKLKSTAYTFTLSAVPDIAIKACRRSAKKDLGLKGKIEDDRLEEYAELVVAYMLTAIVSKYFVHAGGIEVKHLDLAGAKALKGHLPEGEYAKLDIAVGELQNTNAISATVTADADFSASI